MRSIIVLAAITSLATGAAFAQYGGSQPATPPAAQTKPATPPAQTRPATPPAGTAANPNTSTPVTETQAKARLESQGYSNVSQMKKDAQGMWTARAMKDGKSVQLSIDARGQVSPHN